MSSFWKCLNQALPKRFATASRGRDYNRVYPEQRYVEDLGRD